MTDDEFLNRFEACTLPNGQLAHGDHVRLAWLYLRRQPVLEVLATLSTRLEVLARANGKADRYHETITWAYILLIRERMARTGRDHDWQEFAKSHADLLDSKNPILRNYYCEQTLRSDIARRLFVFPDFGQNPL
jgi:hypothetical protein